MPSQMPPLEIICHGPPTCRVAGGDPPPDVLWRKNLALLVYLALSPGRTRSREHLLGMLWPEKEETKARHSLNEAVRRLRQGLGAARISSHGDALTLDGGDLSIDLSNAEGETRGDFLEGLTLNDAPAFEEWIAGERRSRRAQSVNVLLSAGESALAGVRFADAGEAATRVLAMEPYSEPAIRLRMRAATLAGDASGALSAFHEFARGLQADIGEQPSRELSALAERIRAERWRRKSAAAVEVESPLVGRREAHEDAFEMVGEAGRAGIRVVALLGEQGMGKTRLLGECLDRWQLEGGVAAMTRGIEGDRSVPWSALRGLARGGLLGAPGMAAADPAALSVLACVVPELQERAAPSQALDHAQVATALSTLISAIAEEQPVALAIDDAQFADPGTITAIQAAAGQLKDAPVFVGLAVSHESAGEGDAIATLLGQIGRRLPGAIVRLDPLRPEEITELVGLLADWCPDREQLDRLSRRVVYEVGGNPFFATTLLKGLRRVGTLREDAVAWPPPRRTIDAPVPIDVPELVRLVTVARAAELGDTARQVLVAACVGGRVIEPTAITAVTGLDRDRVEAGLVELERSHFVIFEGDHYFLEAPIIAAVIRGEFLTPSQRKKYEAAYRDWATPTDTR